jgi:uncharacterized phage-associated protein
MRFPFNERKAAQAAAFLLNRHQGTLNYMLLIKLLYYADRESLLQRGRPITGDQMTAMPWGPVLSELLDFVRSRKAAGADWAEYISSNERNYIVRLIKPAPETDKLSAFELGLLARIDETHGWKDPFELSDESHYLPEFHDPNGSSIPIDIIGLLEAENASSENIKDVVETANLERFFRELEESDDL